MQTTSFQNQQEFTQHIPSNFRNLSFLFLKIRRMNVIIKYDNRYNKRKEEKRKDKIKE